MKTTQPLEAALAYRNDHVVADFCTKYDVSEAEARELFEDVKRWVWACAVADERGISLMIDGRLLVLDHMWHTFVLFTRDYHAFCHAIAGRYIHHLPTTRDEAARERAEADADFGAYRATRTRERQRQYELLYDLLGEETVRRWYLEYPARYSTHTPARIAVRARRRRA